jgi:hypothetical protein
LSPTQLRLNRHLQRIRSIEQPLGELADVDREAAFAIRIRGFGGFECDGVQTNGGGISSEDDLDRFAVPGDGGFKAIRFGGKDGIENDPVVMLTQAEDAAADEVAENTGTAGVEPPTAGDGNLARDDFVVTLGGFVAVVHGGI